MLNELQSLAAAAARRVSDKGAEGAVDFASTLEATLAKVSAIQKDSHDMQQRLELGDSEVNLQDVMVSLQKASLSFQTMVQVRNKLVSVYQDMMNMQV